MLGDIPAKGRKLFTDILPRVIMVTKIDEKDGFFLLDLGKQALDDGNKNILLSTRTAYCQQIALCLPAFESVYTPRAVCPVYAMSLSGIGSSIRFLSIPLRTL